MMMAIAAKIAYVASAGKVKFADEEIVDSEESDGAEDSDWGESVDSESVVKFVGISSSGSATEKSTMSDVVLNWCVDTVAHHP